MINLNGQSWQEFLLRTLTLHWLTATVVVLCVMLLVATISRLNATTRHNIWLLTLVSLALMPLLIFAPRPEVSLPTFSLTTSVESSRYAPEEIDARAELTRERTQAAEFGDTQMQTVTPPVASGAPSTTQSTPITAGGQISLLLVVKGIFVFWLVGVLFLLRRLWGEYRAARELELQSDSVTPYFDRRFDQLCARLGIDERPLLRFHAGINAPMTVGLMRVWVAIPMTWRETIDDSVFDQTLTHELGHIARKDPFIHTLQRLLSIVFWMYPAVWYVSRQLEVERESACDDWVLTHDGKSASYATNLLDVAESLYLQPQVLAVGCLRSHSQLSRRIQNLLNKSSDHKVSNSWALLALTSVVLMATLSVSAVVWPDARQLAPPAEMAAQSSTFKQAPASIGSATNTQSVLNDLVSPDSAASPQPRQKNDISRFQADPKPQSVPQPAPVARPEPAPKVDVSSQKTVSVTQDDNGKLTIERHRSGKTKVYVEPEITSKDPVLFGAWSGDKKALKLLASQGENLNRVYPRSISPRTALEAAVLNGHGSVVETLIDLGVDLSPDTPKGTDIEMANPLDLAAIAGRHNIARLLLKNNVSPDSDILAAVAGNRDVRMLELLLQRTECDCLETSAALMVAMKNQDVRSLDVLLKHDAEVDHAAIVMAVQNNNTKILNTLLKHFDDDVDSSALTFAIENRNSAIVDSLIKAGAEPEESALTLAVQQGDLQVVRKLVRHGAEAQEGALVLAIQQRNSEMVNLLIEAGAPADDGALVMAVQQGDTQLVRSLLKHDLDIEEGPLVIAIQKQDIDLVRLLLDAGAEVEDGSLIAAAQTGNPDLINLIRERSGRTDEELQSSVLRKFEDSGVFEKNYQARVEANSLAESTNHNVNINTNDNKNKNKNKVKSQHKAYEGASTDYGEFVISKWPVSAKRISLGFNDTSAKYGSHNEKHKALDFPIKAGSPVYAVADGYVKDAGFSGGYGNYVYIDHGNGFKTKYANNKVNKVSKGDYVKAYQKIALVGNTARDSTGPHLHFEVYKNGKKIDPERVFSPAR